MLKKHLFKRIWILPVLIWINLGTSCTSSTTTDDAATEAVVITLWWVIFNYPANCSDNSCGANDLIDTPDLKETEKVEASVVHGTGQTTDKGGNVLLISSLYPTSTDLGKYGAAHKKGLLKPFGKGLLNPVGAEIHLFIYSSGATIDEHLDKQLTTLTNPSCNGFGGNNSCKYIQEAVHLPGKSKTDVFVIAKPEQLIKDASSIVLRDDKGLKAMVRTTIPSANN